MKTVALPSGDRGRPLAAPQLAELELRVSATGLLMRDANTPPPAKQ